MKERLAVEKFSKRTFGLLVAGVAAIYTSLTLLTLTKWDIWFDESFTARLIRFPMGEMLRRAALDVHPPLYYLLLRGWQHMFGWSLGSLRSMSVIFGVIAVCYGLYIVHQLYGKKVAVYAAPLFALAPVVIRYGQEMRMYTLSMIFVEGAIYNYLRYRQSRKTVHIVWYGVFAALLLYTHYFASLALLAPAALELKELFARPQKGFWQRVMAEKRYWLANVAAGVTFLPWLPTFLDQAHAVSMGFWIGPVTSSSFFSTLSSFVIFRPEWINWHLTGIYAFMALMIAVTAGVAFIMSRPLWRTDEYRVIVATWVLPMLLLFLLSALFNENKYYDRYFSSVAPFFFITLAIGLARLKDKANLLYVGLIVMVLVGVSNATVFGNNYGRADNDHFAMGPAFSRLQNEFQPGDTITVLNDGSYFDLSYYALRYGYNDPKIMLKPGETIGKYGSNSLVYDRKEVQYHSPLDLPAGTDRVWIVGHPDKNFTEVADPSWKLLEDFTIGSTRMKLYQL